MKKYLVKSGAKINLRKLDPSHTGDYPSNEQGKEEALKHTQKILADLNELQELLYANANKSLLIVLQAMDAGGKDGTIRHVMSSFNPQGCKVVSFKQPSPQELAHDFLWRVHSEIPPKGYIGIFNRSHYEDVLVTRVHGLISKEEQKRRFKEINQFEHMLSENGVSILKFFLHISKEEQRERLLERVKDPKKHWKFNINDIRERKYWDKYQEAFEKTLEMTSTRHAPWLIVPANNKWYRDLVVGKCIVEALKKMSLKIPPGPPNIDFKKFKIE